MAEAAGISVSSRGRFARVVFAAALLGCASGAKVSAADFYQGRTITMVVGSDVGGGFDAFARLLSRHLGRAIPGNPRIVVENMPGAGSAAAASYIYSIAPRDGTMIGALVPGGLLAPLFEGRPAAYDTMKFRFLGSANASARLCISEKTSGIATFEEATKRKVLVGAGSVGSASYDYAYLHKNLHHGNFDIVAGYKGMADILLAMERGEVQAVCGFDWSSLKTQRSNLGPDGQFNFLLKVEVQPDAQLDALRIPAARTFAANERDAAVGDLVASQQIFGRPYAVAPGVPADRLRILKAAFDASIRSEQLASEAAAAGLQIDSASGNLVEEAVRAMYQAPADIVAGARTAIRP